MAAPRTLCDLYFAGIAIRRPDRFLVKRDGVYGPVSTDEFADRVRRCAGALLARGLQRGDRVGIFAYNRLDWAVTDYACQLIGVADVPLYSTLPKDQVEYIVKDSGAKLIFVENDDKAAKAKDTGVPLIAYTAAPGLETFDDFLKKGEATTVESLKEHAAKVQPDDLATLIYTSGTTGMPKGVMLTQGNLATNVISTLEAITATSEDLGLSFLPLSHSFQRIVDFFIFYVGGSIAYADSVDAVMKNLVEVKPTLFASVPRFFEKIRQKALEKIESLPAKKKTMMLWAMKTGAADAAYRKRGRSSGLWLGLKMWFAKKFVLAKLYDVVGGRIRLFISGSAALSGEVAEFFWSLGFTLLEGYGLTEASPVITVNRPGMTKVGSVGPAIPGVELKIAEDGEVLARGPNIMKGYLNKPEETAQTIVNGWLCTGDIGEVDGEGFLRITDRKKDLFKTSGGKYIAPQPIENKLKLSPYIKNAVVIGSERKFAGALIVPDLDAAKRDSVEPRAAIQRVVDRVNQDLPPWEQLKKFVFLDNDFTVEAGELTPTMKVRRKIVGEKYKDKIDSMYAE